VWGVGKAPGDRGRRQWRSRAALRIDTEAELPSLPGDVRRRAHFQRAMMMDIDQAARAMREEEMLQEIEGFIEGFNQPTFRGMRINGVWVPVWSSQYGWSGL
jgi:hypothetical protein